MTSRRSGIRIADYVKKIGKQLGRTLKETLEEIGTNAKAYYLREIANWDGKPVFVVQVVDNPATLDLTVRATGDMRDIWYWVDEGTGLHGEKRRAYPITAVNAPALRFKTGYSAKSAPIARGNVGDGSRSGNWVSKRTVMHPGIRGRKFADTYFQDEIDVIVIINQSIQDGIRRVR